MLWDRKAVLLCVKGLMTVMRDNDSRNQGYQNRFKSYNRLPKIKGVCKMEYHDICSKKTYTKGGEEKTVWLKCGTLKVLEDGKKFIELSMFPQTSFYVFKQKPKDGVEEEIAF